MQETAVVVTDGNFAGVHGKTAHGLIRGSERFKIVAVVDAEYAGRDAGEVLDGEARGIPVFESVEAMLVADRPMPAYCVIGCAPHGGVMTSTLQATLDRAIRAGMSIVNGLHEFLSDDPEWVALAEEANVSLIDVRKPNKPLHFWTGEIQSVRAPRIAVLGTECAVGKRTTARLLVEACSTHGIATQMVYTGQTGWMQGAAHGFILDAVPNDFVGGELEHAIVMADREFSPDLIVLEGQSALRNPSGPCGSEFILCGGARGVILQHAPGRRYFHGFEELGCRVPPVCEEIELIRLLGARTLALTLNGENLEPDELRAERKRLSEQLGIPVVLPLEEGVEVLVPLIEQYIAGESVT